MSEEQYFGVLKTVPVGTVSPKGWAEEFLKKQQAGLTGHYWESGYPFDTPMWDGGVGVIKQAAIVHNDEVTESPWQDAWWPYEQCAYLLDGLLKVGVLLKDQGLLDVVEKNIYWLIDHATPEGRLGTEYHCDIHWPMAVFFRAAMAWAEYKDDERVRQAFVKHYQTVPAEEFSNGFRHVNNLEGILIAYSWSGDEKLLEKAEKVYQRHNEQCNLHQEDEFELNFDRLSHPESYVIHGVSFSEGIKLPVMLYLFTGKESYLEGAEHGLQGVLERHGQLPGLITSNEDFAGRDPQQGYETCVINDFSWALRYFLMATGKGEYADRMEKILFNALPTAASPDFHAVTYCSCVNQVISAPQSHHSWFFRGSSDCHQYRPGHGAQCCPGNIHHVLPNFVNEQFFVTTEEEPVAMFYSAAEFDGVYQGCKYHISEATRYPQEEEIRFCFKIEDGGVIPFHFRVPGWCKKAQLSSNGKPLTFSVDEKGFVHLPEVADGTELVLTLPMEVSFCHERNWCWFEAGPLLFSLPVSYRCDKETEKADADYAPLLFTATSEWNYSPLEEPAPRLIRENGKTRLEIQATKISGFDGLECGRYTPQVPLYARRTSAPETISLVPYGETVLRITAFPDGRPRKMLPIYQALVSETYPFDWKRPISEQQFPPEKMSAKELQTASKEIVADRDGYYDLLRNLGKSENQLVYVTLRFWAERDGEATFSVGASTVGEFFVNGRKYYEQPAGFEAEYMAGLWFKAPVHQGYNVLVAKVAKGFKYMQYMEAWGVRADIFC